MTAVNKLKRIVFDLMEIHFKVTSANLGIQSFMSWMTSMGSADMWW